MRTDGVERAIGIVMAPHWSAMSVETYVQRVLDAIDVDGRGLACSFVRSFHDHPGFVEFLAARVAEAVERSGIGEPVVVFTAHSLPVRTAADGSQRCLRCNCEPACRYRDGLQRTGDLVSAELGLEHLIAWQSAGRTDDPWWGPPLEEVIVRLAAEGREGVVVCSAGFVADHLETLYDLDIEAKAVAAEAGIAFARTRMPNADPAFLDVLADVVREHLATVPA
jgi:ferrochelatase